MKINKMMISTILILSLVFLLVPATKVNAAGKIKINKTKTTIYVGKTETLKISGTSKKVKWNSSNKNVATVNSKGKVNPRKEGKVTISAKVSGKTYKCKVTVKNPYINMTSKTLYVSDTYTLKLTGTTIKTVKSSNPEIATINTKGKVTAKKAGTATISITGKDKKTYKCKITVKNMAHKHSYTKKVIKPICTEKGYTLYTCSCGDSYKDNYQNATGHIWDDWKVTKEPTETETGEKKHTCSRCNAEETDTIPVKTYEHEYTETVVEPTCIEQGYTVHICSCGETYNDTFVDALGHSWGEWVTTKEPTETETGEKKHTCTRCNKEETDTIPVKVHEHEYTETVVEPTCTEKGYTTHTCGCGDTYNDTFVDALGHSWGRWVVIKEPTQTEEGIEKQSCTRCEAETTRPIPKKAHEHNYEYKVIKEPTCTEDGIEIYACTICGEDNGQKWAIDAHHTWGEWEITKDAGTEVHTSVEQFGERVATCTVCGEKNTQTIINIDASAFDKDSDYSETTPNFICDGIIQVYGTFHRDMAYETLALVNELRTSLGLNELKWQDKFYDIGSIRASEIRVTFAHRRPNGTKAAYVINSGFSIKLGENILRSPSYTDAQEAYQAWHDSPGHYANMIKDSYKSYYSACFEDEYGGFFWVQLFSSNL